MSYVAEVWEEKKKSFIFMTGVVAEIKLMQYSRFLKKFLLWNNEIEFLYVRRVNGVVFK